MDLRVEPFDREHHDRKGFSCGEPSLDEYLARQAGQDVRRDLASLFCMVDGGTPEIVGYYTLSASSLRVDDLPEDLTRRLPHYPEVPAVLLGRLAIRTDRQGAALGEALLFDAMERSLAGPVAAWCLVVDALDERTATWYARYGLRPLPGQPLRLVIPASTIRRLISPGR